MQFKESVEKKIELVNRILTECKGLPILSNPNFVASETRKGAGHIEFSISPANQYAIPLTIVFDEEYLQIDIENFAEKMVWTNQDIEKVETTIVEVLMELLSSYILFEDCDGTVTIFLFDSTGIFVRKYELNFKTHKYLHMFSQVSCNRRLFFPLYPK